MPGMPVPVKMASCSMPLGALQAADGDIEGQLKYQHQKARRRGYRPPQTGRKVRSWEVNNGQPFQWR